MTQPQFDARISVLHATEPPLTAAAAAIKAFGSSVSSAAQSAAAASGIGPLAGALGGYASTVTAQSTTFGQALEELRSKVRESAEQYQSDDAGAARGSHGIDFGQGMP